jgi:hypothetical protein
MIVQAAKRAIINLPVPLELRKRTLTSHRLAEKHENSVLSAYQIAGISSNMSCPPIARTA